MNEDQILRQKEIFLSSYTPSANAITPEEIALVGAIVSAVRRNPTYSRDLPREQRNELVEFWHNELIQRGSKYLRSVQTLNTYVGDIIDMKASINARYGEFLHNDVSSGIRISQCQKSLSVYLKYMWCQNIAVVDPPLCPIDRIVLSHCGIFDISWTRIDDADTLWRIIAAVTSHAQGYPCCDSVAEWELCMFNL